MTGHSIINEQQNEEFISIMHTMIDDLDTISPNIDEVIYVRLVNGLQRLYNIHNTGTQTSYPVNRNNVNTYFYHVNSDNANNQNNHSMHWIEAALREGITRT